MSHFVPLQRLTVMSNFIKSITLTKQEDKRMQNKTCLNTSGLISKILNTPFNWSLVLMTIIIWAFSGNWFSYSTNQNFDMLIYLQDCIKLLSLSAIIFGLLKQSSEKTVETNNMLRLGIITYVLSLFSILAMKTIGYSLLLGVWIFQPLTIFLFLIIIQQMWEIANKQGAREMSGNNNKQQEE